MLVGGLLASQYFPRAVAPSGKARRYSEQNRAQRQQAEAALESTSASCNALRAFRRRIASTKTPVTVLRAGIDELGRGKLCAEVYDKLSALFINLPDHHGIMICSPLAQDAGRLQIDFDTVDLCSCSR